MGTRAIIAYINSDLEAVSIYSHWDGYLEGVGKTLADDYDSEEKAIELVKQGDCSYPGTPYNDGPGSTPMVSPDMDELRNHAKEMWAEYIYIWDDYRWYAYDVDGNQLDQDESNLVTTL